MAATGARLDDDVLESEWASAGLLPEAHAVPDRGAETTTQRRMFVTALPLLLSAMAPTLP